MAKRDLFISHAWEDKDSLVRPLADAFRNLSLSIWYDEFTLTIGDSLSASIDKGLLESKYGVVVISPNFIRKPWAEYEFRSLVALESGNPKRILPVWYNITRDEVLKYSPRLADKIALVANDKTPLHVALEIMEVVAPGRYRELARKHAAERSAEKMAVPIGNLEGWPFLREPLTQHQLWRIKLMQQALMEVFPQEWEEMISDFQRDHPDFRDGEIHLWERIAGTYLSVSREFQLTIEDRKQLFQDLLGVTLSRPIPVDDEAPAWNKAAAREFGSDLPNAGE
ncbi:toll/interleukin-1 receptor domain-containing protein [Streptosporangium sp. CA-135522]|uniref:toll/interleukin-1 receptor domain-containing protein n=1 Tax=Streptosporangium sp. CA-135522 TaxID=3240072 RepID=UPI003D948B6B